MTWLRTFTPDDSAISAGECPDFLVIVYSPIRKVLLQQVGKLSQCKNTGVRSKKGLVDRFFFSFSMDENPASLDRVIYILRGPGRRVCTARRR